jgi:hypothetical protein
VRVLIERTGCDYMEELVTAVFVAHTKVLTAVRLSTKQKKLSITVPKLDHFVHRVFRESARAYWKSPFLFMDNGAVVDRQKNVLQIEALASEAITSAVRSLLPVKQILQDYLGEDAEDVEDEEEVESEVVQAPAAEEEEEEVAVAAPAPAPSPSPTVPEPEPEPAPAPAPTPPTLEVQDISIAAAAVAPAAVAPAAVASPAAEAPAVVKIDTEAAVHFHDYDAVFDETAGAPEMRYAPKDGDDEEFDDGLLQIDEQSTAALTDDDAEDLEAAPLPNPLRAKAPVPAFNENIETEELVILD